MPDIIIDPYLDCCCGDCAEYGAEVSDQCEVFNAAVAKLPEGFGEIYPLPETTSRCKKFRPSDSLLRNLEDAEAYRREAALSYATKGAA